MVHAGRISIHAPREGGDAAVFTVAVALTNFNPRPPRGGRRKLITAYGRTREFQSTPPARGGRPPWTPTNVHIQRFQSTPPARGATVALSKNTISVLFQSTPPARGATWPASSSVSGTIAFQSTPPARGATGGGECLSKERVISIHAPREGGDRPLKRLA